MTRDEAIEWNKNLKMYMKLSDRIQPCKFPKDNYIALNMAIEALERELKELPSVTQKSETVTEFADRCRECGAKYGKLLKQQPCGDAISRQAVLDCQRFIYDETGEELEVILAENVLNLPSVTPQPKMGHWIYSKAVNTSEIIWSECSECKDGERGCAKRMKYCPNCGAKMESEGT
jgi:hypothetical protein